MLAAATSEWLKASGGGGGPRGRRAAREAAQKLVCSLETLEMLADMRGQFFGMLADIGFVQRTRAGGGGGGGGGGRWAAAGGLDDPQAPWNRYADQPSVVRITREHINQYSALAGDNPFSSSSWDVINVYLRVSRS